MPLDSGSLTHSCLGSVGNGFLAVLMTPLCIFGAFPQTPFSISLIGLPIGIIAWLFGNCRNWVLQPSPVGVCCVGMAELCMPEPSLDYFCRSDHEVVYLCVPPIWESYLFLLLAIVHEQL